MKDRIKRFKENVRKHDLEISASLGLIAGAAITYKLVSPDASKIAWCVLSPEQVKGLAENENYYVEFLTKRQIVNVIVDPRK